MCSAFCNLLIQFWKCSFRAQGSSVPTLTYFQWFGSLTALCNLLISSCNAVSGTRNLLSPPGHIFNGSEVGKERPGHFVDAIIPPNDPDGNSISFLLTQYLDYVLLYFLTCLKYNGPVMDFLCFIRKQGTINKSKNKKICQ